MSKTFHDILEGPTYITTSKTCDGQLWINESRVNASLQDAIETIDGLVQVVLLEGSKGIDVTAEAAELWWTLHRDECETAFDVPTFIHDNASWVYSEIAVSQYNAGCWRDQQVSCNPRVL